MKKMIAMLMAVMMILSCAGSALGDEADVQTGQNTLLGSTTPDPGTPTPDSVTPDSGTPTPDSVTPDSGTPTPDFVTPDSGTPTPDFVTPDSGTPTPDSVTSDPGTPTPESVTSDPGTPTPDTTENHPPQMVKVTFKTPTGNHEVEVLKGTAVKRPETDPTMGGYYFTGWFNETLNRDHHFFDAIETDTIISACFATIENPKRIEQSDVKIEFVHEGTKIAIGDKVTFVVKVDAEDFTVQWQYSEDNGETWLDIEGETKTTMDVIVTGENAKYLWRVAIFY